MSQSFIGFQILKYNSIIKTWLITSALALSIQEKASPKIHASVGHCIIWGIVLPPTFPPKVLCPQEIKQATALLRRAISHKKQI